MLILSWFIYLIYFVVGLLYFLKIVIVFFLCFEIQLSIAFFFFVVRILYCRCFVPCNWLTVGYLLLLNELESPEKQIKGAVLRHLRIMLILSTNSFTYLNFVINQTLSQNITATFLLMDHLIYSYPIKLTESYSNK